MTVTMSAPPGVDSVLANLLLVRMSLPSKKPVGPAEVRRAIGRLLGTDLSSQEFDELRNALASAGLLSSGKNGSFVLADAGRQRALQFLGVPELPTRVTWPNVIAKYLLPKAAGLSAQAAARLDKAEKLASFVLQRKYALPAGTGSTMSQVAEAIVCKELGYADETSLNGLLCAVLSELMGAERLAKDELVRQLPLYQTGVTKMSADAWREKLVRDGLGLMTTARPTPPRRAEPFDLQAFAHTVRRLAVARPAQDRFFDNKVFIAPLWRASQQEATFPRLSLAEFKQHLIEANAQGLLQLSRADLVQEMDPQLVAESETPYLNASFHFVTIEGDRP